MKHFFWLIILAIWFPAAYAIKVKSIYQAEVPVRSQDAQLREQAIQQAFIQTLNKMSGRTDMEHNATVKAALPEATNDVEEFGYVPSGIVGQPYLLQVQFDPKAMKELLQDAQAPIWDENRPLILVWLTVEGVGQGPDVIDNQSTHQFALLLKKEASQRGLPLLLPMMDLSEINAVSAADIRSKTVAPLQKAATRYNSDGILIGSVITKDKIVSGQWKLVLGANQWDWTLSSDSPAGLVSMLNDKLVKTLSERYAAVQTEDDITSLTLTVKGVAQQEDFENMLRFIRHISLIKQMEIEKVSGDLVVIDVDIEGAQSAFMQEVSVGQHMHLQLENDDELTYVWTR